MSPQAVERRDSIPATSVVILDSEGRVWAKEYEIPDDSNWLGSFGDRTGGTWWVREPGAESLVRVDVPSGLTPLDARGDLLLGVTTDDLGVQRVVAHRMRPSTDR